MKTMNNTLLIQNFLMNVSVFVSIMAAIAIPVFMNFQNTSGQAQVQVQVQKATAATVEAKQTHDVRSEIICAFRSDVTESDNF